MMSADMEREQARLLWEKQAMEEVTKGPQYYDQTKGIYITNIQKLGIWVLVSTVSRKMKKRELPNRRISMLFGCKLRGNVLCIRALWINAIDAARSACNS